jgi:hypothetical protein
MVVPETAIEKETGVANESEVEVEVEVEVENGDTAHIEVDRKK